MIEFLGWYLAVSLLGLLAFPLAYHLLPGLPDRGYAFSRALGVLLWGYVFWLAWSVGILRNDLGGLLIVLGVLVAVSILIVRKLDRQELLAWWREQRRLVIQVEILFFVAFAGWAIVRAANPEIFGTEKPMELAFINAILRSPQYPPHDPWLSGFAISYYYFGYVLVAMLARLTGSSGSVAFNLGLSLVFALSAVNAYGLVYDLLRSRALAQNQQDRFRADISAGKHTVLAYLGPFFILLLSNIEGFLELIHHAGWFWLKNAAGELTSRFWTWLDIVDLNQPPAQPFSLGIREYGSGAWWWWRASRVVQDYNFDHTTREIIDEFPFFSFLLGDLHPHVLAMPFMFLAMALALNLYLGGARGEIRLPFIRLNLSKPAFLLAAIVLGGMAFLNTWDILVAVGVFAGAYALDSRRLKDFIIMGLSLGIAGGVLYLPFFLSFSSQFGGIVPGMLFFTRGNQFWVMFATLLLPLSAYLVFLWRKDGSWQVFKKGLWLAVSALLILWALMWLFSLLVVGLLPLLKSVLPIAGQVPNLYLQELMRAPSYTDLLRETMIRRLAEPGTWISLVVLFAASVGLVIWGKGRFMRDAKDDSTSSPISNYISPEPFAVLLVGLAALLLIFIEFFYLRDQFGYRINTIFKFFYQAWLLWGIVAAYGMAVLLQELRRLWAYVFRLCAFIVLALGLVYTAFGLWDKAQGFNPPDGLTLDGGAYLERWAPNEMAAIHWLQAAPYGVMVEAVSPTGGSYSEYARVSEFSGLPTVLGWIGHEHQWRGGGEEVGSRQDDIQRLYGSRDWEETKAVIEKYNIKYIVLGPRERSVYHVSETKFQRFLTVAFQQGDVMIYVTP